MAYTYKILRSKFKLIIVITMLLKTLLVSICIIHSFGHPLEKGEHFEHIPQASSNAILTQMMYKLMTM